MHEVRSSVAAALACLPCAAISIAFSRGDALAQANQAPPHSSRVKPVKHRALPTMSRSRATGGTQGHGGDHRKRPTIPRLTRSPRTRRRRQKNVLAITTNTPTSLVNISIVRAGFDPATNIFPGTDAVIKPDWRQFKAGQENVPPSGHEGSTCRAS